MIKQAKIVTGVINCPVCSKNHLIDKESGSITPQGLILEYEGDGYRGEDWEVLQVCPNVDLVIRYYTDWEITAYFSHKPKRKA